MRLRWLLVGLVVTLLLVPAGALTVARFAQPPGGMWVRLVSFTPYALPLYVLALLLLAAGWAAGDRGWKQVAATLSITALAGAVMHAVLASSAFLGGAVAVERGDPLRVMTLNLMLGEASVADVVDAATSHDVDVLVLQEVGVSALDRLEEAGLSELLPHRAGRAGDGATGTVVLARQRIGEVRPLDTELGGYEMTVGDVTLLAVHPRPPVGDAAGWVADHRAIRRAAYERAEPTLIVGDFNATTDHRVMRELDGRGYSDAATDADSGWQPTWPADDQVSVAGVPVPPVVALDHVLTNGVLHAVSTETVSVDGTDHLALLAILAR